MFKFCQIRWQVAKLRLKIRAAALFAVRCPAEKTMRKAAGDTRLFIAHPLQSMMGIMLAVMMMMMMMMVVVVVVRMMVVVVVRIIVVIIIMIMPVVPD